MITNNESERSRALNTYDAAFELYKQITPEKTKIASIIKKYVNVLPEHKVLDVGSAQGTVVKMVQPNLENITMVDIIDQDVSPCRYIQKPFEGIYVGDLVNKYDLVIASHVWGHLYHNQSEKESLWKIFNATKYGGYVAIVSNTNKGFFGDLGEYVKRILPKSQINKFDEELLVPHQNEIVQTRRCYFNTILETPTIDELVDVCRVFFVNDDAEYDSKKSQIKDFLRSNLYFPELVIEQKAIIMKIDINKEYYKKFRERLK